jgi:hypothetical protein
MVVPVNPADPCPCGSGKALQSCCLHVDGSLRPAACSTRPPGRLTGFANPDCYAAALGDCSPELSREHFISESVLRRMAVGGLIDASGFPWARGATKKVSPAALATKVLCTRHNSALSPLDAIADRLFSHMYGFRSELSGQTPSTGDQAALFNGHDIERWMVKLLSGLLYSGNSSIGGRKVDGWMPPTAWLKVQFGLAHLHPGAGLYLDAAQGQTHVGTVDIQLTPLRKDDDPTHYCGLLLALTGVGFVGLSQAATFGVDTCCRNCSGGIMSNAHQSAVGRVSPRRA